MDHKPPSQIRRSESVVQSPDVDFQDNGVIDLPRSRKLQMTFAVSLMAFVTSFGSSVFSTEVIVLGAELGTPFEVTILGVSLYVLGFALGESVSGLMQIFMSSYLMRIIYLGATEQPHWSTGVTSACMVYLYSSSYHRSFGTQC